MSHVTYKWVMSHINESCHIWISHVTYVWVLSHMNKSCHIWMSHVTYEWVMSHIHESCRMESVMSHRGKHTHRVPGAHTAELVPCHIWLVYFTWDVSCQVGAPMWHDTFPCAPMWHDSFPCAPMLHFTFPCAMTCSRSTLSGKGVMSHVNESCHMWMSPFTWGRNTRTASSGKVYSQECDMQQRTWHNKERDIAKNVT